MHNGGWIIGNTNKNKPMKNFLNKCYKNVINFCCLANNIVTSEVQKKKVGAPNYYALNDLLTTINHK